MHFGPLLFGTLVVVFIFLLQFIFKFLTDLVGKGLSYAVIGEFIFYNLAWMLVLAVPIGILFATLMAYGKLSGQNELTIVKSSGGSALRAMAPALLLGAILSVALWLFNDKVLPETNHKAHVMQTDIKGFRPSAVIEAGRFINLEGNSILAREVDREQDILYGVSIYRKEGATTTVVNAERAELAYDSTMTVILISLYDGEVQRINRGATGDFRRFTFRTYTITIETRNNRFEQTDPTTFGRNDRTMNIAQMQEVVDSALVRRDRGIADLEEMIANRFLDRPLGQTGSGGAGGGDRNNGGDGGSDTSTSAGNETNDTPVTMLDVPEEIVPPATTSVPIGGTGVRESAIDRAISRVAVLRGDLGNLAQEAARSQKEADKYLVEIYKKYAIPLACLIFVLVGAPLGILVRRGNFGVAAVIVLGFYVIYWACLVVGEKLADRGVLSPSIAMFLGDIVIGVVGIYLITLVTRETVQLRFDFPRLKKFVARFRPATG